MTTKADDPSISTTDGRPPAHGYEDAPVPQPYGPDGQAGAYWVLSEAERAKGFIRPLRRSYRHVGPPGPRYPLRDLDDREREQQAYGYVKFEPFPESEAPLSGRYWTQAQLDGVGKGCGTVTTMGLALCETYARDPSFYGATFCCGCGKHLPVAEFTWTEDGQVLGS